MGDYCRSAHDKIGYKVNSRKYEPSFTKTFSICMNHADFKCDKTHNLDGLLMYNDEKNDEFVKDAQEKLCLMEKEMFIFK